MPYIKPERRAALKEYDTSTLPRTAGELNYVFARLIDRTLDVNPSYEDLNTVIGVLECCLQEVYRRVGSKMEDRKIGENGDVFRERD